MIPVTPAPEPATFHSTVRAKGHSWLVEKGLPQSGPLPEGADPYPFWRACLPDLYRAYDRICAYVAVEIPPVTGTPSADHFVAKSLDGSQIYEWSNYRLACTKMNSRKRAFTDVLDPFEIDPETFLLDLATGTIRPNPALSPDLLNAAQATIDRLALDDKECRDLRAKWFDDYRRGDISADYFRRNSPFVWAEAVRQRSL